MQRERKLVALKSVLDDSGWIKGDEAIFFCPKCKHRKRKLAVNLETDMFHCWVCGWKGKDILPILRLKGDTEVSKDYAAEREKAPEAKEKTYDKVVLPKEYRFLGKEYRSPWYRQAINYLNMRGITEEDIFVYKLGYCEDGDYRNRIIMPSFDEYGELNFVVGRSFLSTDMKYKTGHYCKDIIFNDYLVDWSEPISLVEGPFDSIKAGTNTIPLQGIFLNEGSRLFRKIIERQTLVYLALDADAWEAQYRIAETLMRYGVSVGLMALAKTPWKDPGDMPRGKFNDIKFSSMIMSSTVDLMKMRLSSSGTRAN